MEKTFYFVNGISPDEPSKKLMRRHVMKGKNAGKTIRRRSRLDLQVAQYRPNTAGNPSHISENLNEEDQSADWRYESPNRLDTRFGDAFLTFSLPVEVTPNSREIINECKDSHIRQSKALLTPFSRLYFHG